MLYQDYSTMRQWSSDTMEQCHRTVKEARHIVIHKTWKNISHLTGPYTPRYTSKAGPYCLYIIMSLPSRSEFFAGNGLVPCHTGECIICHEDEAADPVTTCKCNSNIFCRECISSWLKDATTCPWCRADLLVGEDDAEVDNGDENVDDDDFFPHVLDPFFPDVLDPAAVHSTRPFFAWHQNHQSPATEGSDALTLVKANILDRWLFFQLRDLADQHPDLSYVDICVILLTTHELLQEMDGQTDVYPALHASLLWELIDRLAAKSETFVPLQSPDAGTHSVLQRFAWNLPTELTRMSEKICQYYNSGEYLQSLMNGL